MKRISFALILIFTLGRLLYPPTAHAYQRYNDGCQGCHGAFTGSTSTKGSTFPSGDKHAMHNDSSYMNTDCNLCHTSGDKRNPYIGSSDGLTGIPGLGCTGCHGRNEDMGHDAQSAGRGAGLRQHHWNTGNGGCADCHTDADPAAYTPVAESVNPPYYGTTGTRAKNPCNPVAAANTNENWTVGAPYEGLDTDGNNLYDGNDPACGVTCTYAIAPASTNLTAAGGTGSIGVTAGTSCVWTATPGVAWVTINSGGTGSGNGTVNYSVAVNATSLIRTGTVTIATQTFRVIQAGACTYAINPTSTNLTAAGGTGNVAVTAAAGCAWTAASTTAWITVTSGASGSGNGTVGYSVAANTSSLSRTGTATIAGLTFTVRQTGTTCTYVLNPTTQAFTSSGGTGSFSVTTPAGCAWTSSTGDAWITTTSSGSGNGTVNFSVGANASSLSRTGTIAVAGQNFTVTQTGVACTYSISPTNAAYAATSGSGTVNVTAPVGCAWTAVSNDAWLTVTSGASGSGNGPVGYNVAANTSSLSRTGTVTIAGKTLTVTQSGTTCTYVLNPTSQAFTSGGGTGALNVTVAPGCAWTATTGAAWITTTSSGSGNGTVNFSVGANASSLARTGTITVASQTFTVTQTGVACTYAIAPTNATYAAAGGTGSVSVTTPGGCAWTAASNAGWITVTSGASGSGNGSVGYSIAANASSGSRTGTVTIATQTFTVTQTGASCTYSINPASQAFTSSGGTGTFNVTATTGCAWTASTGDTWITTTSSGSGNGTVNFSVGANASSLSRTGTISMAGQNFTVTQTGVACTYAIAPTNAAYAATSGSGTVNVTAPVGCAWTAVSNDAWLTVTSGATGSGSGPVGYNVAANTSSLSRTGTVTIAGKTLTVTQSGTTCTYVLNPTSQAFTPSGGTGTFNVTATAGCAWTATTGDAWITTTSSGSGNGSVNFSVGANAGSLSRTGTIAVAGQNFTITQTGVACTYSTSPANASYAAAGGTGNVNVTAPVGCTWMAASNDAWIMVTSGASGSGNGSVGYSVAANAASGSRTGTVTVAGQTLTVVQSGVACSYLLSPTGQAFAASGGTGNFNVTTENGCPWTAASNDSWITITGGGSGSGNGTVSYSVAANSSSVSRTGTVSVAGQAFTVTQAGANGGVVDLDIARFNTRRALHLGSDRQVRIQLWIRNSGTVDEPREATVVGVQNGVTVYSQTLLVSAASSRRVRYEFPSYSPRAVGEIQWTATIADDDPDTDLATDTTQVKDYHSSH